jgi:hypothetical protein
MPRSSRMRGDKGNRRRRSPVSKAEERHRFFVGQVEPHAGKSRHAALPTATHTTQLAGDAAAPRMRRLPTRGKSGLAGGGYENWKSEAKHKDAFLTPAGRYVDLKRVKASV